ncbi:GntR family transcriptional regulator [Actinopolymorpha pittospori]
MDLQLETRSLVDAVTHALRDRILTGEIPAGAALTEQTVATGANVARPTAKAAIERLTHEGLLRRGANKTARVPQLDADDIADLYFSRMFLEREAVAALARASTVPEPAREAHRRFQIAAKDRSLTGIVEADIDFHVALVAALNSPRVSRMHTSVMGEAHLCMAQVQAHRLLTAKTIATEHGAIVDAIASGEEETAARLLVDHLERARDRLVNNLAVISATAAGAAATVPDPSPGTAAAES